MKESLSVYIPALKLLQMDLSILMKDWDSATISNAAKIAGKIARLIAGQIEKLQGSSLQLNNEADPVSLRNELKSLCELMNSSERDHFAQYLAMLDSLINDETY